MIEIVSDIVQQLVESMETPRGVMQLTASVIGLGLLAVAAFVRTMVPLRAITVASNVCLLTAGALAQSPLHMAMYLVLAPLNTWRLMEIKKLTRKVEQASARGDLSGIWLRPYMKPRRLPAGAVLFRQGDPADSLYLLVEGELDLVEIAQKQEVGQLFGEISFFSPDGRRTLTARCVSGCLVLCIGEEAFKQLYFQNPKFAFQISGLIAHRLAADIDRLRRRVEDLEAQAAAAAAPATPATGAQPAPIA